MTLVSRFSILLWILIVFSCQSPVVGKAGSTPPSHQLWNELLKAHVKQNGQVDYQGFIREKPKLDSYLKLLSENAPDRSRWSNNEQLSYWINVYNAFTVKLIVDYYPTKSIRDLGPRFKIPLIKDVWHYKFFKIAGVDMSLDEVEHSILRKEFEEPRIHFAINCASVSCPPLLNEAFVASNIENQLTRVATSFINDLTRNKISSQSVQLSSIFLWFKGDFTKKGTLIEFLNRYSSVKISANARITFLDYNWNLNE
uniref:DUF547 domain-containing protein n=1 Tax=Algoriphagus sp. TaxID=1872435 RepID=UPI0040473032